MPHVDPVPLGERREPLMQPLPIFLAANDAYACFAATAMMSIAEHTTAAVHFHLFDDRISDARRAKLTRSVARYPHVSLTLHGDLERRLDACLTAWYPTRAIFSRYFIAELFPAYERCLYVDVDIVFQADVAEIFAIGTGDDGLAACRDMGLHTVVDVARHKAGLGIPLDHDYFNNGMILIDASFWRRNQVAEKLAQIALERRGGIAFPSQDPMNVYFSPNRYQQLPQRFNVMPSMGTLVGEPAVLHFTWPKPWQAPTAPYADRFWEIARRSPFATDIWWACQRWRLGAVPRWFQRTVARRRGPPVGR